MAVKSGRLWALVGASRSGKTAKARQELRRFRSVLIWDIEGDYRADVRVTNPRQLLDAAQAAAGRPGIIAFTGMPGHFNDFCRVAFWWVRKNAQAGRPCAVVVEETSDVTNPGKAPEHWGVLLRRGLKYGADIFAISQRPAESDKTAVGNASIIHVCRLNTPRDRKYIADMTGIPFNEISGLRADQDAGRFDYFTVDTGRGVYRAGRLTFPGGKAKFTTDKTEKPL